ncbi:hypothetical protein OIU74_023793 [Salix koriyanagi]|uniref:Homologous recombination OB-fold protein OB-fold domain-containing protein n=1 Tax=Salix koriyanagi TaxID=2511006 RepID=A0A9Q0WCY3_9ROSI|nr:hypothetical protein OIU74_023793 [Salix koriyanagi]
MDTPWEEALDLNNSSDSDSDSDLLSLRPLKRHQNFNPSATTTGGRGGPNHSLPQPFLGRCSQNTQNNPPPPPTTYSKIPGPAGTVQAAMHRRKSQINEHLMEEEEEPIPTQEYIRRAVEGSGCAEDNDFTSDPWLSAVDFVRHQGLVVDGDGAIGIPLSVIKRWASFDRVAQVVAIVKSCRPNGHGDMMVTLKDPTGTIDASIHHKVLTDGDFGKDISIGAVMIVQKVAVFCPTHFARYLNITLSNMIKVISKDGRASPEQNCSAYDLTVKNAAVASDITGQGERSQTTQNLLSLSQGRTEGIMNSLRQHAMAVACIDEQMEEGAPIRSRCHSIGSNRNENAPPMEDHLLVRQDLDSSRRETDVETDTGDDDNGSVTSEKLSNHNKAGREHLLEGTKYGTSAADSVGAIDNQEKRSYNGTEDRLPPTSRAALPQWTDEQLEELFAFD